MLAAFIRERTGQHWPPPGPGGQALERSPRPDLQAAISAPGRRRTGRDLGPVDLAGADLTGALLAGPVLARADLFAATLVRAGSAAVRLSYDAWCA
jgi:hypothetical protein